MSYTRLAKFNKYYETPLTFDEKRKACKYSTSWPYSSSLNRDKYIIVDKMICTHLHINVLEDMLSRGGYKGWKYMSLIKEIIELYDLFSELQYRINKKEETI